jgi:hypothetical protein
METLDELFRGTGIRYEIYGRQIALLAKQETALPAGIQQTGVITGKVTDRTGAPLPGVTVVIKGTTTGTITKRRWRLFNQQCSDKCHFGVFVCGNEDSGN